MGRGHTGSIASSCPSDTPTLYHSFTLFSVDGSPGRRAGLCQLPPVSDCRVPRRGCAFASAVHPAFLPRDRGRYVSHRGRTSGPPRSKVEGRGYPDQLLAEAEEYHIRWV